MPTLAGFLSSRGYRVAQRDLSVEVAVELLETFGGDEAGEALEILRNPALSDEAKTPAAAFLDDLALTIRDEVDPDFGFSRYAEHLGAAVPDFGIVLRRLRRRSAVDRIVEAKTREALEAVGFLRPSADGERMIVGITCPFPGTLLAAFRIASAVRRLAPHVELVLGGGYVNTELRALDDRRIGRFFDVVMYDEGYAPWLEFLGGEADNIPVFVRPSYSGLDLSLYFDMPESENPMHRLWSTGRWIKLQAAKGCYWHRCAFCDVTLDYIRHFAMPRPEEVVDAMVSLADEFRSVSGTPSFHFTDEALPPALIGGLCRELIRRRFKCRWWGNIRFDSAFGPELVHLMSRAGCIAVSGGLECAEDRLLTLMNKGISCASARQTLTRLRDEGIMVHAYLMYGFPTQTEREAHRALAMVRRCFRERLVQSAFFHRFALTVHSPVARDPKRFGIRLGRGVKAALAIANGEMDGGGRIFAMNEIPYSEPWAPNWTRIGRGLALAVRNFNEGRGIAKPIGFWFQNCSAAGRGSSRR